MAENTEFSGSYVLEPNVKSSYDFRPRGHTHSLPSVMTFDFMLSFIIKAFFNYK